jgi:hypothetical protein
MNPRFLLVGVAGLLAGCFQDSTPKHSTFLPLDYLSTFQTVRTCRLHKAHKDGYERVLANVIAADPYTAGNYPLPAGSVVIAEHHEDPSCNSLDSYYLMAKENPGYDSATHDWHWQLLDANQRVTEDGRLKECSSCHAEPSCNDYLCSLP